MASRVMALGISIALFVAVWSMDQTEPRASYLAQLGQRSRRESDRLRTEFVDVKTGVGEDSTDQLEQRAIRPAETAARVFVDLGLAPNGTDHERRLPDGIVPGRYRVVTTSGKVGQLTLTAADLFARGRQVSDDGLELYILTEPHQRTYFIRLESPVRMTKAVR